MIALKLSLWSWDKGLPSPQPARASVFRAFRAARTAIVSFKPLAGGDLARGRKPETIDSQASSCFFHHARSSRSAAMTHLLKLSTVDLAVNRLLPAQRRRSIVRADNIRLVPLSGRARSTLCSAKSTRRT